MMPLRAISRQRLNSSRKMRKRFPGSAWAASRARRMSVGIQAVSAWPEGVARTCRVARSRWLRTPDSELKNTYSMPSASAIIRDSTVLPEPCGPSSRMFMPLSMESLQFLPHERVDVEAVAEPEGHPA